MLQLVEVEMEKRLNVIIIKEEKKTWDFFYSVKTKVWRDYGKYVFVNTFSYKLWTGLQK